MARWAAYLLVSVVLAAAFAVLLVVANNFYWGASPRPGGDYYLFHRELPGPLGALLWAAIKPLLFVTPAAAAWALYRCVRARSDGRGAHRCPRCGYDLTGNVSGVCPECGTARA
jgi:hypothetical protein